MSKIIPCVGLFGTCGNSTWRKPFIERFQALGVNYFNPQVDNWTPECADIEAQHLKRDSIILFPVTGETYGTGSLAETGFSIIQAITSTPSRWVIVMIDMEMDEALKADEVAYKESMRARKLVTAHLKENQFPNVFVVSNFEEMFDLTLDLFGVVSKLDQIDSKFRKTA
jgi:hypothetical protein